MTKCINASRCCIVVWQFDFIVSKHEVDDGLAHHPEFHEACVRIGEAVCLGLQSEGGKHRKVCVQKFKI